MGWSRSILLAVPTLAALVAGSIVASIVGSGSGCVRSTEEQCGDFICPSSLACVSSVCVDRHLLVACDGLSSGAECTVQDQGSGTCDNNGVCSIGRCGDGVINGEEECDGLDLGGKTCLDFGGTTPAGLSCNSACQYDTSGCSDTCGNGKVNPPEQCDGSDFGGKSCQDFGYYGGSLLCTSTCTDNFANCTGRCGDGIINGFEQCDGTNLNNQTCATLGYLGSAVVPLMCGSGCAFTAESCTCGGTLCTKTTQTCVESGGIAMCQ